MSLNSDQNNITHDQYLALKEHLAGFANAKSDEAFVEQARTSARFLSNNFNLEFDDPAKARDAVEEIVTRHRDKFEASEYNPSLEVGSMVQYGSKPGMWRVGYIVGRYQHTSLGDTLCVRTPHNAVVGQQFDNVPVKNVRMATVDDLNACMRDEWSQISTALNLYFDNIPQKYKD